MEYGIIISIIIAIGLANSGPSNFSESHDFCKKMETVEQYKSCKDSLKVKP